MANESDEPDPPTIVTVPTKDVPAADEQRRLTSWYASDEFTRLLMEHFTKARNTAIAFNPPDMPG